MNDQERDLFVVFSSWARFNLYMPDMVRDKDENIFTSLEIQHIFNLFLRGEEKQREASEDQSR